jgi:hypothetical protein
MGDVAVAVAVAVPTINLRWRTPELGSLALVSIVGGAEA